MEDIYWPAKEENLEKYFKNFTCNSKGKYDAYKPEFIKLYKTSLDYLDENREDYPKYILFQEHSILVRVHFFLVNVIEDFSVEDFKDFDIHHFMESYRDYIENYPYVSRASPSRSYFDSVDYMLTKALDFGNDYYENYKELKSGLKKSI